MLSMNTRCFPPLIAIIVSALISITTFCVNLMSIIRRRKSVPTQCSAMTDRGLWIFGSYMTLSWCHKNPWVSISWFFKNFYDTGTKVRITSLNDNIPPHFASQWKSVWENLNVKSWRMHLAKGRVEIFRTVTRSVKMSQQQICCDHQWQNKFLWCIKNTLWLIRSSKRFWNC